MHIFRASQMREKAQVWLLLTKKLKQRNATVHAEWRQPGGPVGMRWVRARAAASPALRSHKRVITSLTDTLSHFSASASMCLCLPPSLRLLKRISSHPWHTPVLALFVCLCLSFGWVLIKHEMFHIQWWWKPSFSFLSTDTGGEVRWKRSSIGCHYVNLYWQCSIAQFAGSSSVSHTFDRHC